MLGIGGAFLERFVDSELPRWCAASGLTCAAARTREHASSRGGPCRVDHAGHRLGCWPGELRRLAGCALSASALPRLLLGRGVPIVVAGSICGALVGALREGEVLPRETERRMRASPN